MAIGFVLLGLGCDRARQRDAEQEPPSQAPVATGSLNQAMGANQRIAPRLPTSQDRFLLAVREGDRDAAQLWLEQGARIDEGAVMVAAVRGKGDLALVEWLQTRGAGVDVSDESGRTPLSWAAGRGSIPQVDYLLKHGASVATADQLGRAPLHYAVFGGEEVVVNRLLDASAAVDVRDALGSTPLMYACSKNQADIVRSLLRRGADLSLKDKLGRSAAERAHGADNPCVLSSPPE